MAVTLQADPTLAGLNAYCTRAEANSFLLESRLHALTAWEACTNKDAAIMWATRELDRLDFIGYRASSSQRHEWPRSGVPDVASTVIPQQMKEACAELAFYLAQADRSVPTTQEQFEEIKAGDITLKFREAVTGPELTSEMPDSVRALVRRFIKGGLSGRYNRRAVRA